MTRAGWLLGAAALALVCSVAARQDQTAHAAGRTDTPALPERLSETGLYAAERPGEIDPANRRFAPQYPLWTDGLVKRRWIYLPPGTTIDARDEYEWEFPVGTKLWKEFALQGRPIETRLLWKTSPAGWTFASYVWNGDGSDATLAPADGVPGIAEVAPGRRHSIPARTDCVICHGARPQPLGVNALQLSPDRDPHALHGEPLLPGMVTLKTLQDEGRLSPVRADLLANPPRIRTANPATRTVLGYLAGNCGGCHNGRGEIAALGPTIRLRDLVEDGDAVAQGLIGQPARWQIPGAAPGTTVLVKAGAPHESALVARLRSRSPSSQMPPLGTVVQDREAVDAITHWIREELAAGTRSIPGRLFPTDR